MMAIPNPNPATQALNRSQVGVIFAVLLASIMTGMYTRQFLAALPDLRAVWGLSVDEGAWLGTLAIAPQMLIAPVIPWLVTVFGVRPVMIPAALAFIFVTAITPLLTGYIPVLVAHFIIGALLGCFITATILILAKCVPIQWWLIPLGVFVFRLGLTVNGGVFISALYTEYFGWQWIYWQASILMLLYITVVFICVPQTNILTQMLKHVDVSGMLFFCLGTTLLYIGLDQGERLGWFDSSVVSVFLVGGTVMLFAFCLNECIVPAPLIPFHTLANRNIIICFGLMGCFGMVFMGNAVLITQFLGTIHAFKPLQTGQALLIAAVIQLVLIPATVWITRRVDARLVFAAGFIMQALACWQGTLITADWMAREFIPMGILFGCGNALVFMGTLSASIANFNPKYNSSILAVIQVGRLLLPTAAGALVALYVRIRRDTHTEFLSEHLVGNDYTVSSWMEQLGGTANGALSSISDMVSIQASTLAFQDTFQLCFWGAVAGLVMLVFMRPSPPNPMTPVVIEETVKL